MQLGRGFTAARRRASWLANKASVDLISRWPFALRKNTSYAKASHPAGVEYVPAPTAGEPSGDRQRREKALPFLKEEKSEHECARQYEIAIQLVCARHCELPLSKMGNKSLFPVVAVLRAFFGTFFRFERKYYPLRGGSPTVRAGVGASFPHWRKGDCACRSTKGLFFPPLEHSGIKSRREAHKTASPNSR